LKSAVANAENNANLKVEGLVVKEAVVGEGPTIKRMMARARGSGSGILKRTSHIRIVLTDEIPIETRETRKAKKKADERAKKEGPAGEGVEGSKASAGKKTARAKKTGKAKPKK
jgi:large subunit ribosomal protein L22